MIGVNRRRYMGGGSADEIIMTSTSNPEVMAICYAQGWAAHANYMTKSEAEAVINIGTVFMDNTSITHFEELQYFNVSSLNNFAFNKCINLETVTLPATVSTIGIRSFASSPKLAEINLDDVQSIGDFAFYNCTSLTSVNISRCQSLDTCAFYNCTNLTNVGSVASITTGNYGAFQNTGLQGSLSFTSLQGTVIPGALVAGCTHITSIEFPVCLYTSVGESAFHKSGVVSFSVREGCTTANSHSFSSAYLEYIDLPSSFTTWNGFALYGNESQKVIVCRALTPPSIEYPGEDTKTGQKSFFQIPDSCRVYVPSASLDTYKVADGWRALKDRMLSIEGSWYETHREIDPNDE